ncbi:hypothetical protein [Microbacterium gorillae]|uniref:hypothetical protein n=1 Tax=Microbacterium gorillae TaxID=1231063 RepID=UPI00058B04B5|nr:hypothetical protein [Microbacterium gorillae]
MVAHVLRLRLDLLLGSFRGERSRVIRTVLGGAVFIAAIVAVVVGLLSLREDTVAATAAVTVFAGSALVLGIVLAPMIAGFEDLLDPRRFAPFGLAPRPLAVALLLAAPIGVPAIGLIAVCAVFAVVWSEHGAGGLVSWLSALLALATCLVATRVSMACAALLLHGRRTRELTGVIILAVIVVVVPVAVFLGSLEWGGIVPPQLGEAADILALTPLGAAWAIPGAVAAGEGGVVALIVAVALLTLVLLTWAWFALVARMLSTIERPILTRERGGLGWFAVTPGTPAGAVAARSLVYWMKDRRYLVNVIVVPIAAVVTVVPLLIAGVPADLASLLPVVLMALFLGWMPHNDVAYDSTAVWLHIVSGVRGISDRLGRLVPIVLFSVPLLAVAVSVSVMLHGRWAVLPAVIGVVANLFLAGLGLSSISSVVAPYPVTRPGDSPFQQPQRAGSGVGSQALVLLGAILFSLPSIGFAWIAVTSDVSAASDALWAGLGAGVAVLVVGLAIGALLFDHRGSRIMEFAEAA